MKYLRILAIGILASGIFSCSCIRKGEKNQAAKVKEEVKAENPVPAEPPLIIYKTKADYTKNVPVLLSCDKTHIISFPHPRDLRSGDKFRYPTLLKNGYLLDNKGITKDVAFLEYTYEEYASFESIPDAEALFWKIIDKDPLTEFCNCGSRLKFDGNLEALTAKISNGECECK